MPSHQLRGRPSYAFVGAERRRPRRLHAGIRRHRAAEFHRFLAMPLPGGWASADKNGGTRAPRLAKAVLIRPHGSGAPCRRRPRSLGLPNQPASDDRHPISSLTTPKSLGWCCLMPSHQLQGHLQYVRECLVARCPCQLHAVIRRPLLGTLACRPLVELGVECECEPK